MDAAASSRSRAQSRFRCPRPEGRPLAKGAKGDGVKEIQEALRILGFMDGKADGDFGGGTDKALKLYQKYLYEREGIELYSPTPTPEPTPEPTPSPVPSPTPEASFDPDRTGEPAPEPTAAPTPTPYAPDGIATDELKEVLLGNSFEVYREDLQRGMKDEDNLGEVRLQRRLAALWAPDSGIDGDFGAGTDGAQYFRAQQPRGTGVADEVTWQLLFSATRSSPTARAPYLLKVSIRTSVYAYKWINGSYSARAHDEVLHRHKGRPTPRGTFSNGGRQGAGTTSTSSIWAQYAYRISGPYLTTRCIQPEGLLDADLRLGCQVSSRASRLHPAEGRGREMDLQQLLSEDGSAIYAYRGNPSPLRI